MGVLETEATSGEHFNHTAASSASPRGEEEEERGGGRSSNIRGHPLQGCKVEPISH